MGGTHSSAQIVPLNSYRIHVRRRRRPLLSPDLPSNTADCAPSSIIDENKIIKQHMVSYVHQGFRLDLFTTDNA
ncbi:hypothetical protein TNCV_112851 [Trichonephila clavipes]|nr:hypothetical protein TNCV_112851 [Trichonephila clavipes]